LNSGGIYRNQNERIKNTISGKSKNNSVENSMLNNFIKEKSKNPYNISRNNNPGNINIIDNTKDSDINTIESININNIKNNIGKNNPNQITPKNKNKMNEIKDSISSAYASIVSLYMTTDLCDDPNAESICEASIKEALNYCPDSIDALLQLSNLRIIRKRDKEAKEAMFKILDIIKKNENGENAEQDLPERDILINLSQNFAELKIFKEACYIINILLKKDDEDIECYYLLAVYEENYHNYFSSMEALDKFNKIYMKLQKNKIAISPVLQQYVDSAKVLYNKLSKIKKEKLVDENPDDENDDNDENEDMEEDEDIK
jgi:hypothetical protein